MKIHSDPAFHFDADPDPGFYWDADHHDPASQNNADMYSNPFIRYRYPLIRVVLIGPLSQEVEMKNGSNVKKSDVKVKHSTKRFLYIS